MRSNQVRYTVNKEKDFTRRQVIYKTVDVVYFHNFNTDKVYSDCTLENESRGFGEVRSALVKFDKDDNIYYFSCLNRAMCKECCDDIIANQDRFDEDIPYEVRHYNFYAEKLNLDKI